jgi:hypothetical protein
VACAAVSSLEACPTPALKLVPIEALPRARAGVRQPLTRAGNQQRLVQGGLIQGLAVGDRELKIITTIVERPVIEKIFMQLGLQAK